MAAPFLYPTDRHRRRLQPKQYRRYQTYKKWLREEFAKQCVYCRMPDGMAGTASFGVDHYRPKEKFPELIAAYENLFYACNACNSRKGDYWPTSEERDKGIFLPNPCDHKMASHARFRVAEVQGRSVAGKWMIELLQLNDEVLLRYRAALIATVKTLKGQLNAIDGELRRLTRRIESAGSEKKQRLAELARELKSKRAEVEESLLFHTSGP